MGSMAVCSCSTAAIAGSGEGVTKYRLGWYWAKIKRHGIQTRITIVEKRNIWLCSHLSHYQMSILTKWYVRGTCSKYCKPCSSGLNSSMPCMYAGVYSSTTEVTFPTHCLPHLNLTLSLNHTATAPSSGNRKQTARHSEFSTWKFFNWSLFEPYAEVFENSRIHDAQCNSTAKAWMHAHLSPQKDYPPAVFNSKSSQVLMVAFMRRKVPTWCANILFNGDE